MNITVILISVAIALLSNFIVLIIRVAVYKRNSKKRIIHAETHSKMIEIMLKYNELKLAGEFKKHKLIDKYLQQSVYYSEHFSTDIPKTKKIKYNSDLSWSLMIELSQVKNKQILELLRNFTHHLAYEYKSYHPVKYFIETISEKLFILKQKIDYRFRDVSKKIDNHTMDKIDDNVMSFGIDEDSLMVASQMN